MSNTVTTVPIPPGWVAYYDMGRGIVILFDPTLRDPVEIVALASGDKEVMQVTG